MVVQESGSEYVPQLEYEKGPDCPLDDSNRDETAAEAKARDAKLVLVFCLLVVFGTGNTVFAKLQAVPMYNYPNFLNLFTVLLYIPITFAYIIPVATFGLFNNAITPEQTALSKRPFAIMGCLDCLAGLMQIFASCYLPGPLLVLLPQAAIPISMLFSRHLLGQRYRAFQYMGAVIVLMGIVVVLEPMMTHRHAPDYICQAIDEDRDCSICQVETKEDDCLAHRLDVGNDVMAIFESQRNRLWNSNSTSSDDDEGEAICEWISATTAAAGQEGFTLIWSGIMILSCVPMTLSSIYKEIALGQDMELDPVYMNGWIAIFQFIFSILLVVPAGMASSPPILPADLPRNLYNGFMCYLGSGSIETGCHPDSMCASHATLFVNVELFVNIVYCLLMMYVLKFGSANVLFLALTVMVPLGNLVFALPIMPQRATFHLSDLLGLGVIMAGLVLYRFADRPKEERIEQGNVPVEEGGSREFQLREPLLIGDV